MTGSKVCSKCRQELPLSEFHRRNDAADGRNNRCRGCRNEYQNGWRGTNGRSDNLPREERPRVPLPHVEPVAWVDDGSRDGWRQAARCRGLDWRFFFPQRGESTAEVKAFCAGCPVREQCLAFAFDSGDQFAVLGATTERGRRLMRRGRGRGRVA